MKSSSFGRKKAAVGVGAVLLLAASLITVSAAVSAQSGPTSGCSNDNPIQFGSTFFGIDDFGNHLLSSGPTALEFAYSLPAGTYDVSAVSTDGYTGRDLVSQDEEQWFAQFMDASGMVLATTSVTGDVPDLVEVGTWSGSIGEVVLAADVTEVRLVHNAPSAAVPNSVRPVCLGATLTSPPPAAIESSIMVDFDSTNIDPSTVSVECGADGEDSGTGEAVDIMVDPVTPGAVCTVNFPPAPTVCTMSVDPIDPIDVIEGDGTKTITFPPDISVDVKVDIDCTAVDTEVLGEIETVVPEPVVEDPPPAVEVLGEVETAPVASVQPGNPTFTG